MVLDFFSGSGCISTNEHLTEFFYCGVGVPFGEGHICVSDFHIVHDFLCWASGGGAKIACLMSFTWVSHIAAMVLKGC